MTDFYFKADDNSLFLYVWYPDESNPRYMINCVNHSCTCKGWTIRQTCKHLDEYKRRLTQIAEQLKHLVVLK